MSFIKNNVLSHAFNLNCIVIFHALNSITLLQQNLVVEYDLQSFISFTLESVKRLGGNVFAASIPTLNTMQELRKAGAATGYPLPTRLLLAEKSIQIAWGKMRVDIAKLEQYPAHDSILQLQLHLKNSTALADPAILLQRNQEMIRHLDEVRIRTDEELATLQTKIEAQQNELQHTILQAETDSLTGLFNRRAFKQKLDTAFRHTMRQKNVPLSLVLLDVDFFKQINDTFGHQHGDAYLIKVAHSLRNVIREDVDFAFRFGGDEFALVIFADHQLACDKAQRVLKLMENQVSIGIIAINQHSSTALTLETYIQRADAALYEAKRQGRGRIIVDICSSPNLADCSLPCPRKTTLGCSRYVEFTNQPISACPPAQTLV